MKPSVNARPRRWLPAALWLAWLAAGPAAAQDNTACGAPAADLQHLSLAMAVDLALCNNPRISAAWAGIRIQAAALGEAHAAYLPTVNAAVTHLNDRTAYPGLGHGSTSLAGLAPTIGLNWRLFDFGERDANHRLAQALLDAAYANHEAVLQKTLAGVVNAYFDAQTQLATRQARLESQQLAEQTLASEQRRAQHGAAGAADVLQAQTALAKARLESNRAASSYRKSLTLLVYALGLAPDTTVEISDDSVDDAAPLRKQLQEWLDVARRHPAIRAARAGLDAARQKAAALRAQGLPTVDVGANIYQNGRPNQGLPPVTSRETLLSVTLNIPLFDGHSQDYKVRGAQAQIAQKDAELADTEHQILQEVIKVYADASAALDNLAASQQLLESAQDGLASTQRKFEHGAADLLELLTAQSSWLDARQERIRCQMEWRSARLGLMANAGILGRLPAAP